MYLLYFLFPLYFMFLLIIFFLFSFRDNRQCEIIMPIKCFEIGRKRVRLKES